jgi:hypothetical protein
VSLADAAKAAPDFVILRTLPGSVRAFCTRPDIAGLLRQQDIKLNTAATWLIVGHVTPAGNPEVWICNEQGTPILRMAVTESQGVELTSD